MVDFDHNTASDFIELNLWVSDGVHFALLTPHIQSAKLAYGVVNDLQAMVTFVNETDSLPGDLDWLYSGALRESGDGYLTDASSNLLTLADLNPNLVLASPFPGGYTASSSAPQTEHAFHVIMARTGAHYYDYYGLDALAVGVNDADPSDTPAVPEPASLALAGMGAAALLMRRRPRK